jgi:hypothetical protein
MLMVEPKFMQSNKLVFAVIAAILLFPPWPMIDRLDPRRAIPRNDILLLIVTKSNVETLPPMLPAHLTLIVDPMCMKSKRETRPARSLPYDGPAATLNPDPRRTIDLTLKVLPRLAKFMIEQLLLMRAIDLSDTLLPSRSQSTTEQCPPIFWTSPVIETAAPSTYILPLQLKLDPKRKKFLTLQALDM